MKCKRIIVIFLNRKANLKNYQIRMGYFKIYSSFYGKKGIFPSRKLFETIYRFYILNNSAN